MILASRLPLARDALKTLLFERWGWDQLQTLDPAHAGPWTPDLDPTDAPDDDD